MTQCIVCQEEFDTKPEVTTNLSTGKEQTNIRTVCSGQCGAKLLSKEYGIPIDKLLSLEADER